MRPRSEWFFAADGGAVTAAQRSALAAQGVIWGWARSLGLRPSISGGTRSPPPPPLLHRCRSGMPTVADICSRQRVPMSM